MRFGLIHRHRAAPSVVLAHVNGHFQFVIQTLAGSVHRLRLPRRHSLAHRAVKGGAHTQTGSTTMVSNWHPKEIGRNITAPPYGDADIACMVVRGVEVGVLPHLHRRAKLHLAQCLQGRAHLMLHSRQRIRAQSQKQSHAQGMPGGTAHAHQITQIMRGGLGRPRGQSSVHAWRLQPVALGCQVRDVQHLIAHSQAAAKSLSTRLGPEASIRQVLNREITAIGVVQPAGGLWVVGQVECGVGHGVSFTQKPSRHRQK